MHSARIPKDIKKKLLGSGTARIGATVPPEIGVMVWLTEANSSSGLTMRALSPVPTVMMAPAPALMGWVVLSLAWTRKESVFMETPSPIVSVPFVAFSPTAGAEIDRLLISNELSAVIVIFESGLMLPSNRV